VREKLRDNICNCGTLDHNILFFCLFVCQYYGAKHQFKFIDIASITVSNLYILILTQLTILDTKQFIHLCYENMYTEPYEEYQTKKKRITCRNFLGIQQHEEICEKLQLTWFMSNST
jgi:hypothetical protein